MPIEQSRAEYLQALLQQRNQLNKTNNNLLNPSVSNDLEAQATFYTNMNQKSSVSDIPQPAETTQETGSDNWFMNIVSKVEGFFDNVSHAIYEGVFGAVEGAVDLGANIIGAIGEGTGWYDSDPFNSFVEYNAAEKAADWMTNFQSNIMGARGITNLSTNSAKYGGDFWRDLGTGEGYNNEQYDTLYGGKANRSVETPAGEFVLGMANSVGFMLPSLAIGNYVGAGSALGKLAGTVAMGVSAAGKGSEQALNEGASASEALGYGALSGAIEGVSEYIIPESKFAGVLGKGVSKSVAKTFIKTFVEEGLEEVFSATLEPLAKWLTYDKSAIEQYGSTDYWFGTNGHFNESVIGQFTSGGVLGGIMGGSNVAYMKKAVGTKGITVLDKLQEMIDTDSNIQKTKDSKKLAQLEELSKNQSAEYLEAYKDFMDNSTESQKQKMAEMLSNPKVLQNILEKESNPSEYVKNYLNEYFSKNETIEKRAINNFAREMQKRYGTDYEIKYGSVPNNANAYVDSTNKTIVINDKIVAEKGGALLAHEYFGHVLGKNLSAGSRAIFYNNIKGTEWYKQNESKLIDAYQINDDTYKSLDSQAKKNAYFQDEVIAYYLQEVFGDKTTAEQIKHLKAVFSQPNLLERILNVFNKSKNNFNTPNIVKEYAKTINKTVDALYQLNKNNKLLKALYKEKHNYKLTTDEESLRQEYKNLFELVKEERQAKPQMAYSKELKKKQLDIIVENNPMLDDYHTGIRSVNDIKTWNEVLKLDDWSEGQFAWGDFTREDADKAKNTGKITIYSSYPIKDGVFVSTSYQQAYEYAGHNKSGIYSKTVDLDDVAWINGDEGQFAKISNNVNYSKNLDTEGNELTEQQAKRYKNVSSELRDENGRLKVLYHGTQSKFTTFDLTKTGQSNNIASVGFWFGETDDGVRRFSDSVWYGDGNESNVLKGYLKIENPKIFESTKPTEARENEIISKRNALYKKRDNVLKSYSKEEQMVIEMYSRDSFDGLMFKYYSSEMTKEKLADLKKISEEIKPIDKEIKKYNDELLEERYSDAYEKFRTDIYKTIGENAETANLGGLGRAVYRNGEFLDMKKVAKQYREQLIKEGYDGIIIKGTRFDNETLGVDNNQYVIFNSNQFKNIDNYKPTDSPDFRYSKNLNNQEQNQQKTDETSVNFKNIQNTREMLDGLNEAFRKRGYNISYPIGYRNFVSKAFTEINSRVKLENQTNKLFELIQEANIEGYNNDTKSYDKLGKIKNFFTEDELNIFKRVLSNMIKSTPNTEARSKATVSFEKAIDRLTDKAKEYKSKVDRVRVFTNHKNRIKNRITRFTEVTEDEIARNGLNTLLEPFMNIKGISSRGLKEALNKTLEWYNEEYLNENFETLPYNDEIRQKLEDLYLSLGEPKPMFDKNGNPLLSKKGEQKTRIDSLSAEQINTIIDIFNLVEKDIKKQTRATIENKAYARATLKSMENLTQKKGLGKLIKKWKKGFAPSYVLLRELFGNSPLADLVTTDMQQATNSNILYKGKYNDDLKKKMKDLGIKDRQLAKTINVSGLNMTVEQALYLYISLNTETNFNEIDANGFQYLIDNKRLSEKYGVGQAQEIKDALEEVLDDNYKKLGDYLQEKINTEIKQDYIKWYESRYGKFAGRNELGKVGDKTYWMLNRSYQYATNAEKVIKTPVAVFKNSISRERNVKNAVLIGSAVSSYTTYINELGKEIFLKPIYRQAYQILNIKVDGKNVYERLQNIDKEDYKYIEKTLNDTIGGLETKSDLLTNMMSAFSVAKLSLNIGSMMKQFASIYTSNIPLRKSLKASITRLFNPTARAEFRKLVDEIGGLKYREGMAVVQANVGNVQGAVAKIADVGMYGIKKKDFLTVGLGVYSLMQIGQDQFGYKIGTQENIDFVKEHWTEFELSQIGNTALSKSAISRGDYGTLARAVFSFMQGANRAAFGSQINKIGLWQRNHNVDEKALKDSIKDNKAKIEEIKSKNTINGEFDELSLEDDVREEYIYYQAEIKNLESQLKDYQEYKIAGGNRIPVNMAMGLIAQGIFVALINELMKHIKGKKDWDDWDIATLGLNTILSIGVDWIPFVNNISSMFVGNFEKDSKGNIKLGKSYDIQVPAIEVMNEMVDIMNNLKEGNWQTMLRQVALLVGDMTGIPFQTLYQYAYGIVKSFNPEIAYNMNSVLYGTSLSSSTQTLNKYVEKGDINNTQTLVNLIMNNFKVKSNDSINKEIAKLYINGYNNVMPKSYMTYYTDDTGNTVNLTTKQIEQFKKYYDESLKSVNNLINITDYKNLTDEEKAKMIKRIYDAYYSYAKAKTLNLKADSKLGNYLLYTKKNANLSKFMPILQRVYDITDSKTKTRKELVFDYINRLAGFSKGEKLLLLYFSGYSSVANENTLKNYLKINLGFTNAEIKEFLG